MIPQRFIKPNSQKKLQMQYLEGNVSDFYSLKKLHSLNFHKTNKHKLLKFKHLKPIQKII